MEGPTPVSALIHAATMVVAGVYLVARLFPLYLMETTALDIVTVVGALTALYAAMVACAQLDIKRVLAFSTISQIAFMMVSLGVARPEHHHAVGYMASMFHLFTHAMFKALLFLGAGAIIHAVGTNDYTGMHGLRKYMPITHVTFLIGCLAIAGIIPFAGFFSKDEILTAVFSHSLYWYLWMSIVAGLTAFYMFRLVEGSQGDRSSCTQGSALDHDTSSCFPCNHVGYFGLLPVWRSGYLERPSYVQVNVGAYQPRATQLVCGECVACDSSSWYRACLDHVQK